MKFGEWDLSETNVKTFVSNSWSYGRLLNTKGREEHRSFLDLSAYGLVLKTCDIFKIVSVAGLPETVQVLRSLL